MPAQTRTTAATTSRRGTGPRDNARTLLQRLHATPAKLVPVALNELLSHPRHTESRSSTATAQGSGHRQGGSGAVTSPSVLRDDGGLSARDVVIVRYEDKATTQDAVSVLAQWQLQMAALHAMRGGRVALVYAPGTRTFCLSEFVRHLEVLARGGVGIGSCAAGSAHDEPLSVEQAVARQQARVLAALALVTVVACEDIEDVYVFCKAFTFPSPEATPTTGVSPPHSHAHNSSLIVPLIMCFGLSGRGSYVFHYERAAGREVPLRHWLLCELRRRVPCTLVVVEWPLPPVAGGGGGGALRYGAKRARDDNTLPLAGPLHADTVIRLTTAHDHAHETLHDAFGETGGGDGGRGGRGGRSSPKTGRLPEALAPATTLTRAADTRFASFGPVVPPPPVRLPIAELTDSQFLYVSLTDNSATLQRLRLSEESSFSPSSLRSGMTSLTRCDGVNAPSSVFDSPMPPVVAGTDVTTDISTRHRAPRCVVEAQCSAAVHATDSAYGW